MAAQITVNQAAKPAGVAGQAREDLDLGTAVTLSAAGGPFLAYLWTIVDKPIDIVTGARSAAALSAPTSSSTNVAPIDKPGTFLVQLAVDSGSGLGALAGDVARITFYAGPALAADPTLLPRRWPATGETSEHNVPDAVDAGGNPDGWAREWLRWRSRIVLFATGPGPTTVAGEVSTFSDGGGLSLARSLLKVTDSGDGKSPTLASRDGDGAILIQAGAPQQPIYISPGSNGSGRGGLLRLNSGIGSDVDHRGNIALGFRSSDADPPHFNTGGTLAWKHVAVAPSGSTPSGLTVFYPRSSDGRLCEFGPSGAEIRVGAASSLTVLTSTSGIDTSVAGATTIVDPGFPPLAIPAGHVFVATDAIFETTTACANPAETFDFQIGSNSPDWDNFVASTAEVFTSTGVSTSASEAVWNTSAAPLFSRKVFAEGDTISVNVVTPSADSSVVTCHLVGYLVPVTP